MKKINWHAIWVYIILVGGVIFQSAYPYLDPTHPQVQAAINAALLAVVGFLFQLQHNATRAQYEGTTQQVPTQRASLGQPPYTQN